MKVERASLIPPILKGAHHRKSTHGLRNRPPFFETPPGRHSLSEGRSTGMDSVARWEG